MTAVKWIWKQKGYALIPIMNGLLRQQKNAINRGKNMRREQCASIRHYQSMTHLHECESIEDYNGKAETHINERNDKQREVKQLSTYG